MLAADLHTIIDFNDLGSTLQVTGRSRRKFNIMWICTTYLIVMHSRPICSLNICHVKTE